MPTWAEEWNMFDIETHIFATDQSTSTEIIVVVVSNNSCNM